ALDLPEEVTVTADPEAAREDGAVLLVHGNPLLDRVASTVLDRGDAGWGHLAWPGSRMPTAADLAERAREAIQVDHGRIEHAGPPPTEAYLPAFRVGVLVSYAVSLEERFQEREDVWIDGRSALQLETGIQAFVASRSPEAGLDRARPVLGHDIPAVLSAADRLITDRALLRRAQLAKQTRGQREDELARASAYYQAALASIEARRAAASPDRGEVLAAQLDVTAAERDRRLAEIAERFEPRHDLAPYRLHAIGVPVLSVALHVRRGPRVFPLALTWVLGMNRFAGQLCPGCGSTEVLVAGRDRLGCRGCLPSASLALPPIRVVVSPPAAAPVPGPGGGRESIPGAAVGGESGPATVPGPDAEGRGQPSRRPSLGSVRPGRVAAPPPRQPGKSAPVSRPQPSRAGLDLEHVERLGAKLAVALWTAVVDEKRWKAKATVPHSPMSALARLYGHLGPLRAVGVQPGAALDNLSVGGTLPGQPARGRQPATCHATTGRLLTTAGALPFTLRWEQVPGAVLVGELLPGLVPEGYLRHCPLPAPGSLVDFRRPPEPLSPLEPAARLLWDEAAHRFGLHVGLRCLALWWRVKADPGLAELDDDALRVALAETVRKRARIDPDPHDQLSLLGPDPGVIASTVARVEALVGPPFRRAW
ncbi:MAG: hypothetical protein ACRDJU_02830, partial [Actinomycetota bacterium]